MTERNPKQVANILAKPMPKTLDESFIDWEQDTFGLGYGTGEEHVLSALKTFFELCPEKGGYDYRILEERLTPTVAWLLINILAGHKVDFLEYGVSPRHAWLTKEGLAMKAYLATKTADELVELTNFDCGDYVPCSRDSCNCGPQGYERGRKCQNPFWISR